VLLENSVFKFWILVTPKNFSSYFFIQKRSFVKRRVARFDKGANLFQTRCESAKMLSRIRHRICRIIDEIWVDFDAWLAYYNNMRTQYWTSLVIRLGLMLQVCIIPQPPPTNIEPSIQDGPAPQ
jgi:hypothetical protein